MIKQKLITLLTIMGLLFTISCGGIAIKRPAFANEESVVGQDIAEVMDRFGAPHGSDVCTIPIPVGMDNVKKVEGDSVFWEMEGEDYLIDLTLCVISDYVVAEKKTVMVFRGGSLSQTSRTVIDYNALADALEKRLEEENSGDRDTIRQYLHKEDELDV